MSHIVPIATAFLLTVGITTWYWPAALFVAFSNEDVTPGARAISVLSFYFAGLVVSLAVDRVTTLFATASAIGLTGVMLLVRPALVWGVSRDGPVTPRRAGVGGLTVGVILGVWSAV